MTSDEILMARLRRYEHPTMDEGAARIERLLVENEMLREELVKHQSNGYERMACSFAAQIVSLREALDHYACKCVDGLCESGNMQDVTCGNKARVALEDGKKKL